MQQVFGTDNHHIQDEGRGHKILFVPFGLKILVRTLIIAYVNAACAGRVTIFSTLQ